MACCGQEQRVTCLDAVYLLCLASLLALRCLGMLQQTPAALGICLPAHGLRDCTARLLRAQVPQDRGAGCAGVGAEHLAGDGHPGGGGHRPHSAPHGCKRQMCARMARVEFRNPA